MIKEVQKHKNCDVFIIYTYMYGLHSLVYNIEIIDNNILLHTLWH